MDQVKPHVFCYRTIHMFDFIIYRRIAFDITIMLFNEMQ